MSKEIQNELFKLSVFYRDDKITAQHLEMYALTLRDQNIETIKFCILEYCKDPMNTFFPVPPTKILKYAKGPEISTRDFAIVLSRKIDLAVKKYGWVWNLGYYSSEHNRPYFLGGGKMFWTWEEAVIEELGQEGLSYIVSMGGWQQVRDSANELNEGTFIAQTRDLLQSTNNLSKQNIDVTKISHKTDSFKIESEKFDIKQIMPRFFS